jgi:hypothetical protein
MIKHTFNNTIMGQLYITSFKLLISELGMRTDLSTLPFALFHSLTTPSSVKSSWQFLSLPMMLLPIQKGARLLIFATFEELQVLNQCQLYLKASHVSDIANALGQEITDDAWLGYYLSNKTLWQHQGCPSGIDWDTRHRFLKSSLLLHGRKLRQPLGKWTLLDDWSWFLCPTDGPRFPLFHIDLSANISPLPVHCLNPLIKISQPLCIKKATNMYVAVSSLTKYTTHTHQLPYNQGLALYPTLISGVQNGFPYLQIPVIVLQRLFLMEKQLLFLMDPIRKGVVLQLLWSKD